MFKMQKNQNVLYAFLIYICNVIILFPLVIYGGQNYSVDSYSIALDYRWHLEAFIGSYRWFGAFVYKLYYGIFKHNPINDSTIDCIIFIVLVAAIIFLFSCTLYKLIDKKSILSYIAINLSVLISVFNVWFCNILSFPECIFITAIGIVLCFLALIVFIKMQNIWGYILSAMLIIFASGIYQQFLFVFVIYVIVVCGCEVIKQNEKSLKQLFLRYVRPIVLIVTSGTIYFIIANIIRNYFNIKSGDRSASGITTVINNIIYYATRQHSFLKGRGYFNGEIMTVCFLIVGAIWLMTVFIDWIKNKETLKVVTLCFSFFAAYASAYGAVLLTEIRSLRGLFPLFSVFALFTIGSLVLINKKYIKLILCSVLIIALTVNIVVSVENEINLKKQNDADQFWSEQIIEEIEKYEKKEQEIKQIYFCYDDNTELAKYSGSAVAYRFSLCAMINYYADRNFDAFEMTEREKNTYFKGKNWKEFNINEQLVFVGDTLYLCCY